MSLCCLSLFALPTSLRCTMKSTSPFSDKLLYYRLDSGLVSPRSVHSETPFLWGRLPSPTLFQSNGQRNIGVKTGRWRYDPQWSRGGTVKPKRGSLHGGRVVLDNKEVLWGRGSSKDIRRGGVRLVRNEVEITDTYWNHISTYPYFRTLY